MPDTVQGFLATISIDGVDITASVENFDLSETRNALRKPTMKGSPDVDALPGIRGAGTLSFDGLIDQLNLNDLQVAWAKDVVVAFSIATVEAAVATNTLWAGFLAMDSFTRNTAGDDLWRFSMAGTISGAVTHTPFVAV